MAVGSVPPFEPGGQSIAVSATTISQAVILPGQGSAVRIVNVSGAYARISFGTDNSVSAVDPGPNPVPGILVMPGSVEIITCGRFTNYVAVKLASGAGTVEFTRGEGL